MASENGNRYGQGSESNPGLKRLIYISSAVTELVPAQLRDILNGARANNRKHQVTGLLLYHDGTFIQVLEGQANTVDTTFARIRRNGLHSGILILSQAEVSDRLFAEWHMAFAQPNRLLQEEEDGVVAFKTVVDDLQSLEDRDPRVAILLRTYLSGFRDIDPAGLA